ncbi:alpha/beta-hydrolase [Gloeophyllum trabeum ATCC 11539]|uniref:Alpha/beta-hydrolase n=1 Tax=Gloeophyllum trabeum (strain ATCC 11539 / FP-39264 / Madison 617) TaxID=670483 RepID=S7QMF6_GLOTA|nr:alpha/beta-hydrolase [Gloeophyllum trabeum ATCC 11539]EPQ60582.1 alpha/beta-hydrolase [Gloeophyllum trabeum ATCC 11539]
MSVSPRATYVFKRFGDKIPIELDVYVPSTIDAQGKPLPVLIWFHGGGLLQGHRGRLAAHMINGVSKYNHILVSPDYRLAPQVRMPEIVSDVADAIKFIGEELPVKLQEDAKVTVDINRVATCGSSAGGWLSLLAALYIKADIKACTAIFPITDTRAAFWTTPQWPRGVPKIETEKVAPYLKHDAPVMTNNTPDMNRGSMYDYMLQNAILNDLLYDSTTPPAEAYAISVLVRSYPPDKALPPIYITHGDDDDKVEVAQSREVVEALKERDPGGEGDRWVYEEVPGKNHGWDGDEGDEMTGLYAFLKKWV